RLILPVACLALTAQLAAAGTYYVDAVAGNDNSGNGSQQHPWRTVTHAMSKVPGPGDVLRIAPGTYDAALGEAPEINVKSGITLQGAGKAATMIRARLVFTNLAQAPSVNNLLFNTMSVSVTGMHSGLNIASCMLDEGDYDHSYISLQAGAVFEPKILSTRIQGRDNKLMQITLTHASRLSGLGVHVDTYLGRDGGHRVDRPPPSGSGI